MPRHAKLPPIHPGEILRSEFMEPLGISAYRIAKDTGMPQSRLGRILAGERSVTADTALRLSAYFGTTPAFWMNLQTRHDLDVAEDESGPEIARKIRRFDAA